MKCPYCGHLEDKVVDSRSKREGAATRRRRECMNCKRRYTTYEYVETPLTVIKRDGSRDTFDRGRLKKGIELALTKRSIPAQKVEKLISEVEEECQKLEQLEVDSSYIGELVMQKLRDIDEVAYIRFASVYRRFEDAGEFRKELDKM
ncbi:transcriptional repressor NrdR [bacterium]|nr:transcriptional repressor NrdR [bacterium]